MKRDPERDDENTGDDEFLSLADSISGHEAVDWKRLEAEAHSDEARAILRELKFLARIADVHGAADGAEEGAEGESPTPAVWGHLEIHERVGRGSFGEVFRAWDPHLDMEVALKLFHRRSRPQNDGDLVQEGRVLARVRHSNVIKVHGADSHDGRVGFWMDFVRGRTLDQIVREQGPFGAREAALVGIDLCSALAAVHRVGLLHQDVKAQNVTREEGGRIVLLDFGAARERDSLETDGRISGTPLFMAPEVLSGKAPTVRSEIYSLGVLLYFLVTGRFPVWNETLEGLKAEHAAGRMRLLRDERPGLPRSFLSVVERALSPEPDDRFSSAGEMERAVAATLGEEAQARSITAAQPGASFPGADPARRLGVLLATRMADAHDLLARHGSETFARLQSRFDEVFAQTVRETGDILRDTESGFITRFNSASEAADAALRFHAALAAERWDPEPVLTQAGIHIGEVNELDTGAGTRRLVGLAVDTARQILELAEPGQILMTRTAFEDARQSLRGPMGEDGESCRLLRWMAHGGYLFTGSETPVNIFEVGLSGAAPLEPPAGGPGARRAVAVDEEVTLGWRPAVGLEIPGRRGWMLERKLGAGGFGEAWVAMHQTTRNRRTFKFCFDAAHLRSFKRELTLFRLLREVLGDRPDIARIHEIQVEQAPFYLESEFTQSGSLRKWADEQGGIRAVPLATRVDLVARIADAVAAAHSVGILHKDIKPSNILMYEDTDGRPRPRLADFGIGILADRSQLDNHDITMTGFTESGLLRSETSDTGTRMYSPPESQVGAHFTTQGDVYALGVLLYQMVVGDLQRPLATGWERDIADAILREDIAACADRDPGRRLGSARALADRLRTQEERRVQRRRLEVRKRLRRFAVAASTVVAVGAVSFTLYSRGIWKAEARTEAEQARAEAAQARAEAAQAREEAARALAGEAEARFDAEQARAAQASEASEQMKDFLVGMFEGSYGARRRDQPVTARTLLDRGARTVREEMADQPLVRAEFMTTMGNVYRSLDQFDKARDLLQESLTIRREIHGETHPEVEQSLNNMAGLLYQMGAPEEAWEYQERALQLHDRLLGPQHPDYPESLWRHAALHLQHDEKGEAERLYDRLLLAVKPAVSAGEHAYLRARVTWMLGRRFNAVQQIDDAVRLGYRPGPDGPPFTFLPSDPDFDLVMERAVRRLDG